MGLGAPFSNLMTNFDVIFSPPPINLETYSQFIAQVFLGITQNVQRVSVNYVRLNQGSRRERDHLIYGQDKCRFGHLIYLSLYI